MNNAGQAACAARETAASQVIQQSVDLVEKVNNLLSYAESKLGCVSMTAGPENPKEVAPDREFPEFFETLRSKMRTVSNRMSDINNLLDRTEF